MDGSAPRAGGPGDMGLVTLAEVKSRFCRGWREGGLQPLSEGPRTRSWEGWLRVDLSPRARPSPITHCQQKGSCSRLSALCGWGSNAPEPCSRGSWPCIPAQLLHDFEWKPARPRGMLRAGHVQGCNMTHMAVHPERHGDWCNQIWKYIWGRPEAAAPHR